MDEGHAKVKMDEVRKHIGRNPLCLDRRHANDSVFYYRIHSPVILIEFDHQAPAGLRNLEAWQARAGARSCGDPHSQRQ